MLKLFDESTGLSAHLILNNERYRQTFPEETVKVFDSVTCKTTVTSLKRPGHVLNQSTKLNIPRFHKLKQDLQTNFGIIMGVGMPALDVSDNYLILNLDIYPPLQRDCCNRRVLEADVAKFPWPT
jgi:hypothetical protein